MLAMSNTPESTEDADPDVTEIWNTWLEKHDGKTGKARTLSLQRLKIIRTAIDKYGKENCLKAVIGCKYSEWHMGGNPQGKMYNGIEVILRVNTQPHLQAKNDQRIKRLVKLARLEKDGGG